MANVVENVPCLACTELGRDCGVDCIFSGVFVAENDLAFFQTLNHAFGEILLAGMLQMAIALGVSVNQENCALNWAISSLRC